jgi:hypothetical protein
VFILYAGSIIEGQGIGATTIKVSANGVNADGIWPAQNAVIRNLTIEGNTTASPGATATVRLAPLTVGMTSLPEIVAITVLQTSESG